jgi:hypothetical protein
MKHVNIESHPTHMHGGDTGLGYARQGALDSIAVEMGEGIDMHLEAIEAVREIVAGVEFVWP